jgi:UDP-N-acetylglucosamine:LPS N-acetylglucosamine transferase
MAAQAAGRLRLRGELTVPSVVVVTDYAVNRLWLHPGNDRYICEHETAAREVTRLIGRPARRHAPLIRPEFRAAWRARPGGRVWDSWDGPPRPGPRDRAVLVVAGSWGTGAIEETARVLERSGRYLPVVLCGRNTRLRRRLRAAGVGVALGWRDDLPRLLAAAYAVVDNAGGLMCSEAFAAGVPVVSYRPIPGHGRDSVRALARAGLTLYARDAGELLAALDRLGGAEHDRLVFRTAALFTGPRAETLLDPASW